MVHAVIFNLMEKLLVNQIEKLVIALSDVIIDFETDGDIPSRCTFVLTPDGCVVVDTNGKIIYNNTRK